VWLLVPGPRYVLSPGLRLPTLLCCPPQFRFSKALCQTLSSNNGPLATNLSFVANLLSGLVWLSSYLSLSISWLNWALISDKTLRKNRKYAMVAVAVLAAVITPTVDPLNMAL